MKHLQTRKMVFSAVCAALCVVLPVAFHSIPNAGTVFSPIHIPVLLCGLACGWPYGTICGLLGTALSSVITGMPPAAYLPPMMIECAVYGACAGALFAKVRTGNLYRDLYIALGSAMILGRIASGVSKALIFAPGITVSAWATVSFITGLPGIVLHLVLIPLLVISLMRARVLPERY